jgi:phosphohistidine swiveling domain-containing protein
MFTKNFTQLNRNDADIAGGKGASLGEMIQSGIPVPEGFVVLARTFEKFLQETDLGVEVDAILETVDHNAMHTVEHASEKIQALIKKVQMPNDIAEEIEKEFVKLDAEFVAVRSSATAEDGAENAWAGQLDSYLNTTQANLLEKVQHCWASLFTPRAIFYRFEKGLHTQKISVAVVVQKMVASEISGIAFSVHPVTEDYNQLIIEAGYGLGEAIVSGSITPDSYVVEKEPRNILDINVSTQTRGLYRAQNGGNEWRDIAEPQASSQVLTQDQILELSEIILGIEKHYGFPCDIEWAYENSKFYIVQSRPITTLDLNISAKTTLDLTKYELHTSVAEFSILLLDMIINNNETYGAVDYVLLYENDITRFYLSAQGMKECYDLSLQLLDDEFFQNLTEESKILHEKLKNYQPVKLDEKNILNEWKKSLLLNDEFCKLYRFYEQPFQQALEEKILEIIPKEKLVEILSQHKIDLIEDEQTKKYVERLLEMGEMKLKLHEDSFTYFTDNSFAEYTSKRDNLPISIINAMRKNELESAMVGKMIVLKEELKQRLKGCVFIKEDEKWNLYTKGKFAYWKNKIEGTHNGEIKGDVAFPGIVKGKVVIHLSWTGTTEIEEGDILVTGMTNPQMIPLLKKASAIVTDEGGITSHAAIISRELKKPCIVGTKNATQVLKDGDFVEVDANHGVVHIVEKTNNNK